MFLFFFFTFVYFNVSIVNFTIWKIIGEILFYLGITKCIKYLKDLKSNKTNNNDHPTHTPNSWNQEYLTICQNFYLPLKCTNPRVFRYHKSSGTCNIVDMINCGFGQVRPVEWLLGGGSMRGAGRETCILGS